MTEIINLKRARKARARIEKDKTAQANRIAHGTPKAMRNLEAARTEKATRELTEKKLDAPE